AGKKPAIAADTLHKRVDRFSFTGSSEQANQATLVAQLGRLVCDVCAVVLQVGVNGFGIVDQQANAVDAVSVPVNVVGDGVIGTERGGQYKADGLLLDDVRGAIVNAGFGALIGDEAHAEDSAIEVSGQPGIADVHFDVVDGAGRMKH